MAKTIKILLVDDIAEVRENVRKLLAFEQDFEVIGSAGRGQEGIKLARELEPDIIIMDINMPDIDGISATQQVKQDLPAVGVIMMSVNSDRDYLRRAMNAGASDFLTKPANMDDLYSTIRSVYKLQAQARQLQEMLKKGGVTAPQPETPTKAGDGNRAGNILVCFSPKGGVGTTTVATNLASALMRGNMEVLMVDADIQFGNVNTFLNVQPQSTISDIVENVDDFDVELFRNILVAHGSGLKVLLGPQRPEEADGVYKNAGALSYILNTVRGHYDFIVVDTASRLDDMNANLMDIATQILLISTPTLPSVTGTRFILDLMDETYNDRSKIKLILNQTLDERTHKNLTIPQEKIVRFLKHDVYAAIPKEEKLILQAIMRGIPVVTAERDTSRSPVREMLLLADNIRNELMGEANVDDEDPSAQKKGRFGGLF